MIYKSDVETANETAQRFINLAHIAKARLADWRSAALEPGKHAAAMKRASMDLTMARRVAESEMTYKDATGRKLRMVPVEATDEMMLAAKKSRKRFSVQNEIIPSIGPERDEINAAIAAAPEYNPWLPIELAPKDGTAVLLYRYYVGDLQIVGMWDDRYGFVDAEGIAPVANPDLWMPIQPRHSAQRPSQSPGRFSAGEPRTSEMNMFKWLLCEEMEGRRFCSALLSILCGMPDLDYSDKRWVEDKIRGEDFIITGHENRGFKPYYILWERRGNCYRRDSWGSLESLRRKADAIVAFDANNNSQMEPAK